MAAGDPQTAPDVVTRWARSPHRAAADGGPADEILRLGCLTWGHDDPARWAQARERLAAHPEARGSIHVAAAAGDLDAARAILAADPGAARRPGGPHQWEPLLYLTCSRIGGGDPLGVARALLEAGADPDAGYLWDGHVPPFTALTGAFGEGEGGPNRQPRHPDAQALAQLLLDHGADPNDEQALYNRHFGPDDAHLELLLARGLGRGDRGVWARRLAPLALTPPARMLEDQLVWAAARGYADRVALLLRHGVDPNGRGTNHPTMHGLGALELADRIGAARISAELRAAGATRPEPSPAEALLAAAMRGERSVLQADPALIVAAVRLDPGRLELAAGLGRPEVVQLLVELGFDPTRRGQATALHRAAYAGDRATCEVLLALGADRTVEDPQYHGTPSGWARHAGHVELADWLDA